MKTLLNNFLFLFLLCIKNIMRFVEREEVRGK